MPFNRKPDFFYNCKSVVKYIMLPFSFLYIFLLYFRYYIYLIKNKKKLPCKVIVIGNCVVGGAGKTPIAITIAKYLNSKNKKVCFVSKGYSRQSSGDIAIPYNCSDIFDYVAVGDEPLLLSSFADVCVVKNRNNISYDLSSYSHLIFDDGAQDYSFKKDLRFTVIDCNFFIGNRFVLPAGPLREPLSLSFKNCDYIILTDFMECRDNGKIEFLRTKTKKPILKAKLKIINNPPKDTSYIAFAAIGENGKFFSTLEREGFKIIKTYSFGDHYCYQKKDIEQLIQEARYLSSKLITTTKDYIKIDKQYRDLIEYLDIEYDIEGINNILF
jgi:tetraacyldisaccharide 4'-kinase